MCQQQVAICQCKSINHQNKHKTKFSYSIKKVLRNFFKKTQPESNEVVQSYETYETKENYQNLQVEQQTPHTELDENLANEKIAAHLNDGNDHNIYVPVRYARTEAGTYFWTTNLQPATNAVWPLIEDNDLLQPAYSYSNQYQYHHQQLHLQDRWAQA